MAMHNCGTCVHKQVHAANEHCYMFKREPQERCTQHSLNKIPLEVLNKALATKRVG